VFPGVGSAKTIEDASNLEILAPEVTAPPVSCCEYVPGELAGIALAVFAARGNVEADALAVEGLARLIVDENADEMRLFGCCCCTACGVVWFSVV